MLIAWAVLICIHRFLVEPQCQIIVTVPTLLFHLIFNVFLRRTKKNKIINFITMFNTTTSFKEQKKLTKFSIILLFSIFLLYGCQSKNDPFKNVNFGKVSTEEFKNDMFNQKIFTEQYEDSTGFRYFVNNGQEKLPVTAVINPDGFKLGKLRQLKIYLSGDTSYMGFYKTDDTTEHISKMFSPGFGPKKITEVNSIIEIYKDWYGEPDSIKYFYQRRTDYIDTTDFGQVSYYKHLKINTDTFQSEEEYDTTNILGIDAVYWHTDKYNIRVNLDFPKKIDILILH